MDRVKFLSSFLRIRIKGIHRSFWAIAATFTFVCSYLLGAAPVFAHHPLGGKTPSSLLEGFMSGVGHPVIGLDHLAFIVAIGILAAARSQGFLIPVSFVMSAMLGTGLHFLSINLPVVELIVSSSILIFGILIVKDFGSSAVISVLAGLAGLFHGFAYGEAIFGAEMTPLVSYLAGFTMIQLLISLSIFAIAKKFLDSSNLKSAGFIISGIGLAFVSSQVMNLLFPLPK